MAQKVYWKEGVFSFPPLSQPPTALLETKFHALHLALPSLPFLLSPLYVVYIRLDRRNTNTPSLILMVYKETPPFPPSEVPPIQTRTDLSPLTPPSLRSEGSVPLRFGLSFSPIRPLLHLSRPAAHLPGFFSLVCATYRRDSSPILH